MSPARFRCAKLLCFLVMQRILLYMCKPLERRDWPKTRGHRRLTLHGIGELVLFRNLSPFLVSLPCQLHSNSHAEIQKRWQFSLPSLISLERRSTTERGTASSCRIYPVENHHCESCWMSSPKFSPRIYYTSPSSPRIGIMSWNPGAGKP